MNFKQQVEEIQGRDGCTEELCKKYYNKYQWDCKQCRTDRILAAHNARLDEIAEGMKICYTPMSDEEVSDDVEGCGMNYESGADDQITADQAHVKDSKEAL